MYMKILYKIMICSTLFKHLIINEWFWSERSYLYQEEMEKQMKNLKDELKRQLEEQAAKARESAEHSADQVSTSAANIYSYI